MLGICMGLKCIHNLFCLTNSSFNVDYLMRCICYFLRKSCTELKRWEQLETSFTGISIILNWRDESKDLTWSNKRIVSKTISICKNDSYNTNKKIKYTFSEHLNMELHSSNQLQAAAIVFFSTIQPYLIWGTLTGLLDTSNSKTQHKLYANFINYYRSGYG